MMPTDFSATALIDADIGNETPDKFVHGPTPLTALTAD